MRELDLNLLEKSGASRAEGLKSQIVQFAEKLEIEDIGFADLKCYHRVDGGYTPEAMLPGSKTGIVYISLLKKVLKKYGKWYVVSLANHINSTNKKLVKFISEKGFTARGIGENEYCKTSLVGKISFRQMAVLAGFGSIGRNSMLIHPKFGPRVVIGVVLTSAIIKSDRNVQQDLCASCEICVNACPTRAIGEEFDRWRCKNRRKLFKKGCGIPCVELCPIGQLSHSTIT